MAKIQWGNFKPRSSGKFNKFTLEKGESARIVYLESEPTVAYVHNFEKIVAGPDGKPKITKDKWPDGTPREEYEKTYAGKMRCLGDDSVLQETGADPENCPGCRAAVEYPDAVRRPVPRFLGHVFRYNVKQGTTTVSRPFSGSILVWDLTERRFETLAGIYEEHGELSKKDLIVGPCENKQMQKYEISVGGGDAKWMESDTTREYLQEAIKDGKVDDLEAVAAPLKSQAEMDTLVREIVRAFRHVTGEASSSYESLIGSDNSDVDDSEEDTDIYDTQTVDDDSDAAVEESSDDEVEEPKPAKKKETMSIEDLLARM